MAYINISQGLSLHKNKLYKIKTEQQVEMVSNTSIASKKPSIYYTSRWVKTVIEAQRCYIFKAIKHLQEKHKSELL